MEIKLAKSRQWKTMQDIRKPGRFSKYIGKSQEKREESCILQNLRHINQMQWVELFGF